MPRIILTILLITGGTDLFAQYIHYSDKRNINNTASPVQTVPAEVKDTVTKVGRDTVTITFRDTLKTIVHDTLKVMVHDTIEIVVHDTINVCPTGIVYHKWPDKCPGLSGAVPVLLNYINPEMVLKLTEIYKGYLYSISSTMNADHRLQYKLKVCEKGVIKFEYADENGNIISKSSPRRN
jgi:hypothetical protein